MTYRLPSRKTPVDAILIVSSSIFQWDEGRDQLRM